MTPLCPEHPSRDSFDVVGGEAYPDEPLRRTREELIDRFEGLTAYTRAPATAV